MKFWLLIFLIDPSGKSVFVNQYLTSSKEECVFLKKNVKPQYRAACIPEKKINV